MIIERLQLEGVEGIRIGRFHRGINTTFVVYRVGSTLIDTGPPNQWSTVRGYLQENQIRRVLVTHHHEDHSGNGSKIRREFGIPVYAPPDSLPYLEKGFRLRFYQHVIWGKPPPYKAEEAPEEIEADDGFRFRRIHSPGHSPDMACYLEPERGWLFPGDLYIVSKPRYFRLDEEIGPTIQSLRRVLAMDFDTIFCPHRGIQKKARRALQEKAEYLEGLRDRVGRLHAEGRSPRQIRKELLGSEGFISRFTGHHFCKRNLVQACLRERIPSVPARP